MADKAVQSQDFRRLARANCYRYGCLYVYREDYVGLDTHNFPNYSSKEGTGAVEKFLTLIQSLGSNATGNDPQDKLSKPLPGVQWSGDDLSLSIPLDGTMYFLDYRDYVTCMKQLRTELVAQGWEQVVSKNETLGMSISSYRPSRHGSDALYNDDPVDAAGMAMMTSAMQHTVDQGKMLVGYASGNKQMYAEGKARSEASMAGRTAGLPIARALTGIGGNIAAGVEAMGANFNSGIVGKWASAGYPVELLIDGQVARQSICGVLTSAKFIERSYVVDDTSGGNVYPTEMHVEISVKNMYGSLSTASSVKN